MIQLNGKAQLRPAFLDTVNRSLAGEWEGAARELASDAAQEDGFVSLAKTYSQYKEDSFRLLRRDPGADQATVEASLASFSQVKEKAPEESVSALKESLELARGFLEGPQSATALQPHRFVDKGQGIYQFSMGFAFPAGNGISPVMDTGILFIDTTPGEDGMTALVAKRASL